MNRYFCLKIVCHLLNYTLLYLHQDQYIAFEDILKIKYYSLKILFQNQFLILTFHLGYHIVPSLYLQVLLRKNVANLEDCQNNCKMFGFETILLLLCIWNDRMRISILILMILCPKSQRNTRKTVVEGTKPMKI